MRKLRIGEGHGSQIYRLAESIERLQGRTQCAPRSAISHDREIRAWQRKFDWLHLGRTVQGNRLWDRSAAHAIQYLHSVEWSTDPATDRARDCGPGYDRFWREDQPRLALRSIRSRIPHFR